MSYRTRYAAAMRARADRLADAPAAVAWREADNRIREQMKAERAERFPDGVTAENADEYIAWHDARYAELRAPVDAEYDRAVGRDA